MVLSRWGFRRFLRSLSTSALPFLQNPETDLFLCNSRIQQLARVGRVDDARHLFDEMPQRDEVTWNSLIAAYFHNGRIEEARALFDAFQGKNVRTWTIAVDGYAKNGRVGEARQFFDEMPERNAISWNAMISGYVQNGDTRTARILFDEMPERNVASWNSMITGYCHCHRMAEAQALFDLMPAPNLVSWTVMISGYVQIGDCYEAWGTFEKMRRDGMLPDQSTFVAILSAVMGLKNFNLIEYLHALAVKTSFDRDVVVGTTMLNVYSRNTELDAAVRFFEGMPERNEYTWTTMITTFSQSGRLNDAVDLYKRIPEQTIASQTAMVTCYAQHGRIQEARDLFEQIPNPGVVTWNAMLAGYTKNGMIEGAKEIFCRMPVRNTISWAAIMAGCAQNGRSEEALEFLSKLHRLGTVPSNSSFTSSLFACANTGALEMGRQIHGLTIKTGSQFNSYVGNGLISMYARCKNMEDVSQVFSTMRAKDIVSWNSLIAGLSQNYMLNDARNAFERMPKRDAVSWTAMISAYVQAGHGNEALELFLGMLGSGTKPNASTITSLLSTCANLGATKLGKQIHGLCFKIGLDLDLFVGNALTTMYFKCGCIDAFWVFDDMPQRDVVTWNAVLAGCAQHGFGKEAIEIFEQMKYEGALPNHISFVGLLCACSHAGLVDEGWHYFNSMSRDYGIMPSEGHYACMVDLLGRAGHLYEAEAFIENMPIEPDSVVWGALLGACRIHQNVEVGRRVAERLFQLEPQNSGNYVLLSNIYASIGMWDEVGEVRKLMKDRGVTKEPGFSWIQVKNRLHSFLTGDNKHEQTDEIYSKLKELYKQLKATGYIPDTNFVLHDVEEEQKESTLLYHSEKLAVVFGLLNTPNGTTIQVMKNLRICGDCHTFMMFVSGVTKREIDIRDGNRFHHFGDGSCSCGDYW